MGMEGGGRGWVKGEGGNVVRGVRGVRNEDPDPYWLTEKSLISTKGNAWLVCKIGKTNRVHASSSPVIESLLFFFLFFSSSVRSYVPNYVHRYIHTYIQV